MVDFEILVLPTLYVYVTYEVKSALKRTRFESGDAVKAKTTEVLNQLTKADFQDCFQQWKIRMERCRDRQGEYIEGEKIATDFPLCNGLIPTSPLFALINKDRCYGSVNRDGRLSINRANANLVGETRVEKNIIVFCFYAEGSSIHSWGRGDGNLEESGLENEVDVEYKTW
ncbi:hypothetical protein NQ318_021524 [Aromia moschata]|uniref:Uncharacterized protein n=1 Tax=Aromia moschata TaxID=1265417 RepID=A0AAV8ZC29_9CUCU|nr:hypothetical protein NQ318_021524 [Aromia moschata]